MDAASSMQMQAMPRMAFTDIAGLEKMSTEGADALERVAAQFESLFVGIWLQSMRDAGKVFGEGNYLSSDAVEMHQEMLDQQWSVHLAESGGIGLRDVIVSQLSRDGASDSENESALDPAVPVRRRFSEATPAAEIPAGASGLLSTENMSGNSMEASAEGVRGGGFRESLFDSAEGFLEALRPVVEQVAAASGIHPVAVLAQAALETGWGSRVIHDADGAPSHNLFGIKAANWSGPTADVTTLEFELGQPVRKQDSFRAYRDFTESVRDYVSFLTSGDRYSKALEVAGDPARFADALQRAGYATDPQYATKLKQLQVQIGRMLTGT